jgi:hypothetical protein
MVRSCLSVTVLLPNAVQLTLVHNLGHCGPCSETVPPTSDPALGTTNPTPVAGVVPTSSPVAAIVPTSSPVEGTPTFDPVLFPTLYPTRTVAPPSCDPFEPCTTYFGNDGAQFCIIGTDNSYDVCLNLELLDAATQYGECGLCATTAPAPSSTLVPTAPITPSTTQAPTSPVGTPTSPAPIAPSTTQTPTGPVGTPTPPAPSLTQSPTFSPTKVLPDECLVQIPCNEAGSGRNETGIEFCLVSKKRSDRDFYLCVLAENVRDLLKADYGTFYFTYMCLLNN